MKTKLLSSIVVLLLCSCNTETFDTSNDTGATAVKMNRIYDGEPTDLVKTILSRTSFSNRKNSQNNKNSQNCETITEQQERTFGSFTRLEGDMSIIFPGNILNGNTMQTGDVIDIPFPSESRNPIEVKVDGFSTNPNMSSSFLVENPTPGKIQAKLAESLHGFFLSGTTFPADYQVHIQRTYSESQLKFALNMGFVGFNADVSGSLGFSFDNTKTYYAVSISQNFYNVSVTSKLGLQGDYSWIKPNFAGIDPLIQPYTNKTIPYTYVKSVTYGRRFLLVYEFSQNSSKTEQALNAAYKTPALEVNATQSLEYNNLLNSATVYVKQLGGSASGGLGAAAGVVAGDFEEIRKFMKQGAEVSATNPGYPIEYRAINMADTVEGTSIVTVNASTQVTYQQCNDYKLIIKNVDFPQTIPMVIRTDNNWNNSIIYLAPNQSITLPYDDNLNNFAYLGSGIVLVDLNNGGSSDDLEFYPFENEIRYRSGYGYVFPIFKFYKNFSQVELFSIDDNINNSGEARLVGKKDVQNNALIFEIQKK